MNIPVRDREEDYVNVNPLQTGGRTYPDTRKTITSYVDGYSVCDWCVGALDKTDKPPIQEFLADVSKFLGMDHTLPTNGCRESKYAVMHAITKPGDTIVVDGNAHYSTFVAAERAGLKVLKVPSGGAPKYLIDPEGYRNVIEVVKHDTGTPPKLAVLTHVDGSYGNVVDAKQVGEICRENGTPLLLNTAYSSGRMPVDGKKLNADFIAASGHKSWAAGGGNIGLLSTTEEWGEKIFSHSKDYTIKPLEILGCSTRGSAMVALMASYPYVKERVKEWGREVENSRWLVEKLEDVGINALGEKPRNHDLTFFNSQTLFEISEKHQKKRYFLYHELKNRGILGIKSGLTKNFKMSTFRLNRQQVEYVAWAFEDIMEKNPK
ncbi:MAG TPA: O-phospho-L-seryl-tRNA:Cys-tRNA synthase [Candidatus Altiarchaeales archaeon]|nr:O-phospho-L-seryl-tRNA:Cys-tRNA synthase [Candidatus Altiarchaeales archaeon]